MFAGIGLIAAGAAPAGCPAAVCGAGALGGAALGGAALGEAAFDGVDDAGAGPFRQDDRATDARSRSASSFVTNQSYRSPTAVSGDVHTAKRSRCPKAEPNARNSPRGDGMARR